MENPAIRHDDHYKKQMDFMKGSMKPVDLGNEIIKKHLKNIYTDDPPYRNLSVGFKKSI